MSLIFVDCEAYGAVPALGKLTEFGAVATSPLNPEFDPVCFHGILVVSVPDPKNPAVPLPVPGGPEINPVYVFKTFDRWLRDVSPHERPTMVSDNPAFDFMWIADGFHRHLGHNPFGYSARRISDFYAGLRGDFSKSLGWKKLRITSHDHNPVHDALGNWEAFQRLLKGER